VLAALDLHDIPPVTAPTAHHAVDMAGEHLLVLDDQLASDGVVVEGLGLLRDDDVEAGEVASTVAPVSSGAHSINGSPQRCRPD
jgi:hypothetical protein